MLFALLGALVGLMLMPSLASANFGFQTIVGPGQRPGLHRRRTARTGAR